MKTHVSELPNEQREQMCAQFFIDWYNKTYENRYRIWRTEGIFSCLAHNLRWDFVAKQNKNAHNWLAIEVKRLIRPNLVKQFDRWKSIIKKVETNMRSNKIIGSYILIPGITPILSKLDDTNIKQLTKALIQAISQVGVNMKERESLDIGDHVLQNYPGWPHIPSLAKSPQYSVVKKADSIFLYKESDIGSQIEISGASDGFTSFTAELEAINLLLDKNKGGITKANKQLGKGKQMGAATTILLFDRCLDSHMNLHIIRKALSSVQSQLCHIDIAYVIDIRQNTVIDVWP